MRVLMVEDDVKMACLVRRGLQEDGHAADVAPTGEDAVWMAQAHPYDAIVLVSGRLAKDHPDVVEALRTLGGSIDAAKMRDMNRAVDDDKRTPSAVADEFLRTR